MNKFDLQRWLQEGDFIEVNTDHHRYQGRLVELGQDFILMESFGQSRLLVRQEMIESIYLYSTPEDRLIGITKQASFAPKSKYKMGLRSPLSESELHKNYPKSLHSNKQTLADQLSNLEEKMEETPLEDTQIIKSGGVLNYLNDEKRYGFISPFNWGEEEERGVWFSYYAMIEGDLSVGEEVAFIQEENEKGLLTPVVVRPTMIHRLLKMSKLLMEDKDKKKRIQAMGLLDLILSQYPDNQSALTQRTHLEDIISQKELLDNE